MEEPRTRKFEIGLIDKIVLFGMLGVLVLLIALNILARCNYQLIHGELYMFGAMLIPMALLAWIVYRLVRRIKERRNKTIVGAVLGIVLMLLFTVAFSYISVFATMTVPQRYGMVVSPSGGRRLVVMRGLVLEEDDIEARRQARLAADPEADPETQMQDYGYRYLAFPPALGLFYRSDTEYQGDIVIGMTSQAGLMVEWRQDETVAHFYLENPEECDHGELDVFLK